MGQRAPQKKCISTETIIILNTCLLSEAKHRKSLEILYNIAKWVEVFEMMLLNHCVGVCASHISTAEVVSKMLNHEQQS